LQVQQKQEEKTDFTVQYTYFHFYLVCAQLQSALAIAVWPSRVMRAAGGSLLSVAHRIAPAAVAVIPVLHVCLVRDGTWRFITMFKKNRAVIAAGTLLCCTQI